MVDTHDDRQIGAIGRGRNDDLLCPRLEVLFRRVALGGDADLAAADIHPIVAAGYLAREAAMHAVKPQQMRIGLDRAEIVDADNLDLAVLVLVSRAQDKAADAAESVA